jgi:beta-glucosidase
VRTYLFAGSIALFASTGVLAAEPAAYLDPTQPEDRRVSDLVSRLTLEEKASLMQNTTPGIPRLGIPRYDWWNEALHGVARAGVATVFPQAIGLAAMWDEPLQGEIAHTIGVEARAKYNGAVGTPEEGQIYHGLTFWSPNINLFRDPRWGRGQETYGEDPFLTSRLGVAFVRGLQGDDPHYLQAAACAKHYAVHSGPESLRHVMDVTPPEADLHETYLPAFEALVREAHVEIVMTAYNSLYGTPCSISPLLYGNLKTWGFNGHITSDCGSVGDLKYSYHRAADNAEAEALVLKAGMNVTCGGEGDGIALAVQRGLLTQAEVDRQVAPLLRTMLRLGFFDPKERVPFNRIKPEENDRPEHAALALRAARESIVLLKNDGTLPLRKEALKRVAVIGPNASSLAVLLGNYHGEPARPQTLLAGLKAALGPGVAVDYVQGCDYALVPEAVRPLATGWFHGEFFANRTLSEKPAADRWDQPIRFDLAKPSLPENHLPAGVPEHGFSVRWSGEVPTRMTGEYRFVIRGRGGFRFSLGGETVIDSWTPPAGQENAERTVSVTRTLAENVTIPFRLEYAPGEAPGMIALEWATPRGDAEMDVAVAKARVADVIVFVGGISAELEGEEMPVPYEGFSGGDRTRIELPAMQEQLLEKLQALGRPLVFVNLSGSAMAFPWADEHVNAIVQAFYPGQAGAEAVADVLLGHYNPAGRLPVTFYRATTDLPPFAEYRMENRTYRYFHGRPLYPFGHGLSYTKFAYAKLQVAPAAGGALIASVDVTNTGDRDGDEVVQLYATPPAVSHPRESEALCGFARVHLARGETKTVKLIVPAKALRRWNAETKLDAVPMGDWALGVGASSTDIRLKTNVKI